MDKETAMRNSPQKRAIRKNDNDLVMIAYLGLMTEIYNKEGEEIGIDESGMNYHDWIPVIDVPGLVYTEMLFEMSKLSQRTIELRLGIDKLMNVLERMIDEMVIKSVADVRGCEERVSLATETNKQLHELKGEIEEIR